MRTINDIIPPSRRPDMRTDDGPMGSGPTRPSGRSSGFPTSTVIIAVVIIMAALGALYYFSSAQVQITPNTVSASVQNSFIADETPGDLSYQIITAQKVASQDVKSTGTQTVTSSASGTITVYNTQTKAQKLITNTRFATTAGLIFRIHAPITIPAGSTAKPGSVTAKVYADNPGDSYDVGPTSFTIPGFAGTPQASEVYARSSAAMTGGASGAVPVVDAATEAQTRAALVTALSPDLSASIANQVPNGYILLPGAATTTFQALSSSSASSTGMASVREQGTITAVVFPNAALAKAIASSIAGLAYNGEPLTILPASNLILSATSLPTTDTNPFSFVLAGTASLAYTVDPTRIAAAVAGKTRADAETALKNYPEIKRIVIILRPFWRQNFPQDPSSISIIVTNP